uniref:Uncharacterized protein n=1 Tax=Manihot esculenta TaxID=3983 RepID=A0A2C9UZZ4_MANES
MCCPLLGPYALAGPCAGVVKLGHCARMGEVGMWST